MVPAVSVGNPRPSGVGRLPPLDHLRGGERSSVAFRGIASTGADARRRAARHRAGRRADVAPRPPAPGRREPVRGSGRPWAHASDPLRLFRRALRTYLLEAASWETCLGDGKQSTHRGVVITASIGGIVLATRSTVTVTAVVVALTMTRPRSKRRVATPGANTTFSPTGSPRSAVQAGCHGSPASSRGRRRRRPRRPSRA